ncbi:hypothetical protein K469DRAFT_750194 [Zopfia rhizophila CBS 207.26]|uniref:Uncharacterized protein n=1 Tax=Zopfia rhizophila CBS 207.26 TaxID=1314779 RepID=A0A6A6E6W6_9PEZI|nr:hypothetical protein K469DRAFT_750194 [Zopfia rhizophila CBS 207.26]
MAFFKTKPTYYPMPNLQYAPDDLVNLGQIFTNLRAPWQALKPPLLPTPPPHYSRFTDWELGKERKLSGSASIFAHFLAYVLGLGADVSGLFALETSSVLKAALLETTFIEPSDEYVEKSIKGDGVWVRLKQTRTKAVFMVTGVKVAKQAKITTSTKKEIGGGLKVAINPTVMSGVPLPMEIGPEGKLNREMANKEAGEAAEFVFAYRVRRIFIDWKRESVTSKEHTVGAEVFHTGEEEDTDEEDRPVRQELDDGNWTVESVSLDTEDFGSEEYVPPGFSPLKARDEQDDDNCLFIIPTTEAE